MHFIKKLIANHAVAVGFVLPNIAINLIIQTILDIGFGWSGWLSILAWMIGGGTSLSFGVFVNMAIGANFSLGKWRYSYAHKEKGGE